MAAMTTIIIFLPKASRHNLGPRAKAWDRRALLAWTDQFRAGQQFLETGIVANRIPNGVDF